MAGNAYSTYTGNVMMTPPGQQALIAGPTVAISTPAAATGTGGGKAKSSKPATSLQATGGNLGGQTGFRSPFGNWNQ